MYVPQTNTVANYYTAHYSRAQHHPTEPLSNFTVMDLTAPGAVAVKLAKARLNGVGAMDEVGPTAAVVSGGVGLAILGAVVLVAGALNYQMGKAMAPTREKAKKWGWIGVPVGFLPLGLPIMAIVSNQKRW